MHVLTIDIDKVHTSLTQDVYFLVKNSCYLIDIEYQSCECRKYFSYVNGTKKFEGKNLLIIN